MRRFFSHVDSAPPVNLAEILGAPKGLRNAHMRVRSDAANNGSEVCPCFSKALVASGALRRIAEIISVIDRLVALVALSFAALLAYLPPPARWYPVKCLSSRGCCTS